MDCFLKTYFLRYRHATVITIHQLSPEHHPGIKDHVKLLASCALRLCTRWIGRVFNKTFIRLCVCVCHPEYMCMGVYVSKRLGKKASQHSTKQSITPQPRDENRSASEPRFVYCPLIGQKQDVLWSHTAARLHRLSTELISTNLLESINT